MNLVSHIMAVPAVAVLAVVVSLQLKALPIIVQATTSSHHRATKMRAAASRRAHRCPMLLTYSSANAMYPEPRTPMAVGPSAW